MTELETIYQVGLDIEAYVNDLTDGQGLEWMLYYLGDITIVHGENSTERSRTKLTGGGVKILLGKGWMNAGGWDTKQLLAHELGHVWDLRQTMQGGIELHKDLGGSGFPWPFRDPESDVPEWSSDVNDRYGNGAIHEYFAEAFSWAIYDKTNAPSGVPELIDAMITDQASELGGR